ncbi:MAG: hypothetical protein J6A21_01655 [Lentisphaeria bacterium]|nr:hypothetical protein [Lentisphaeria bacterium]
MGGDREFFTDRTSGFTVWRGEKELIGAGESSRCSERVSVPASGRYFLEFQCSYSLEVTFGSFTYEQGNTPMLHDEIREIPVLLKKGVQKLEVLLANKGSGEISGEFSARILDEEGNILYPERVIPLPPTAEEGPLRKAPDLSSYTPGVGKIGSFGRFGFSKGDGVLDWSMPSWGLISRPFVSGNPRYHKNLLWHFSLLPDGEETSGSLLNAYHVPENETIRNDWSGVRWTRRLKNGKTLTFDYSVLTPSLLLETDLPYVKVSLLKGISPWKKITLPLAGGLHTRRVDRDGSTLCYDKASDGPLSANFVLFSAQGVFPEVPVEFVLKRSPERIRLEYDPAGRLEAFRFEFDGSVDWMMMLFPFGIELFQPLELSEEKMEEWAPLCRKYAQRALSRPVSCTDYYKADAEKVRIMQVFSFREFRDEWNTVPLHFAPLPPPLSLAEGHVKEIVLDPDCVREKFPTKYGFLYGVENSSCSSYTLPVPDTRRDLAFSGERYEELRKKLESDFDAFMSFHLDAPEVGNPGNYSFVFQYSFVLMVFHLLHPDKRKRLEATIRDGLKKVCDVDYAYVGPGGRRCYSWYNRKEPFSKLDFNMTYLHVGGINRFRECSKETIENTDILMVETDWGNGMSLYGSWFGALFTDSWDLIRENWQVFRHAFDYYLHAMDWACMCASYCENGISWSDGTNYGGYLGFLNMAEMLEKEEDLALGRYAFAKMFAMRAGLFHASQYYYCKFLGVDKWYCAKFFHEETDASRAFLSYPAKLYGNCRSDTLYNITTEGHYKEALDAYCHYMNEEMLRLLDAFLHSRTPAPWEERPAGAEDVYHTVNGVVGWQEVYSYFMCCIRLGLMGREELEEKIETAMKNKRLAREFLGHVQWSKRRVPAYWTYAYLLSTLYGREQLRLTCWKDLEIGKAVYPELEIKVKAPGAFLEFRSEKAVPEVTLDGESLEPKEIRSGLWRVFPEKDGKIVLGVKNG